MPETPHPVKVRLPKCHDCGTRKCHAVNLPMGGIVWLCGSCEVLRDDPEAAKGKVPPGLPSTWPKGHRGKPQNDQLF